MKLYFINRLLLINRGNIVIKAKKSDLFPNRVLSNVILRETLSIFLDRRHTENFEGEYSKIENL